MTPQFFASSIKPGRNLADADWTIESPRSSSTRRVICLRSATTFSMSDRRKLKELVRWHRLSNREVRQKNTAIIENVFATSPVVQDSNFDSLHPDDLRLLYELYDETYFDGRLSSVLKSSDISFRLSRRMTRAGGKTTMWKRRSTGTTFEIAVSTTLLFQSFNDPERPITVTGLECDHRLDALMRVMEHELVHLAEMLVWTDSNCALFRFQDIASRFFGHTDHRHDLMTPAESASKNFGIRPGCHVRFYYGGEWFEGVVNRVTKRATVLVQHPDGQPYSDGHRYQKFYVPVGDLEPMS